MRHASETLASRHAPTVAPSTVISLATSLAISIVGLSIALPCRAQEDARALFERGTEAVDQGRFADAEPDLARSLAMAPRPATAFNLVVALEGLERPVQASVVCTALLANEYGELTTSQRSEADARCAAVRSRLAHLVVRATGDVTMEIRVDGRSIGSIAPGARLEAELDPGWHHVSASASGRGSVERSVSLTRGDRTELPIEAGPREESGGGAASTGDRATPSTGPDVSLIVGLVLGAAALVGGAVVVGVVLGTAGPEPTPGDFPVVSTLIAF